MLKNNSNDIIPEEGLPENLFLEISGLVPIPNVDLFILDEDGRLLLTWREDEYFGKGWHLPGGCIRFKETMIERVSKTAENELGTEVRIDSEPLAIKDVIIREKRQELSDQNTRAHHLAVLFRCYVVNTVKIEYMITRGKAGWFKTIPKDMLSVHDVYREVFRKYHLLEV